MRTLEQIIADRAKSMAEHLVHRVTGPMRVTLRNYGSGESPPYDRDKLLGYVEEITQALMKPVYEEVHEELLSKIGNALVDGAS